jgi:hypothetical protein
VTRRMTSSLLVPPHVPLRLPLLLLLLLLMLMLLFVPLRLLRLPDSRPFGLFRFFCIFYALP